MAWVTSDGEYNAGSDILQFYHNDVSTEQWTRLEEMSDSSRYEYAKAILEKNEMLVREIEMAEFDEEWGL
jgi:hypothetical protein